MVRFALLSFVWLSTATSVASKSPHVTTGPAATVAAGDVVDAAPDWACSLTGELSEGLAADQAVHFHADQKSSLFGRHDVEAYNYVSLTNAVKSKQDTLVVFYAPWCGHCKTFVIADATGNRTNAPLEVLSRHLAFRNGPKVVKFDVKQSTRPEAFNSQYIPSTFLVKAGRTMAFTGNPNDLRGLAKFAMQGRPYDYKFVAERPPSQLQLALPATSLDITPDWACSLPELAGEPVSGGIMNLHAQGVDKYAGTRVQKVTAYNTVFLRNFMHNARQDLLIVFYAPWCGHCKTFVLADAHGNVANAPLEVLNRKLIALKGPKVGKFDVTQGAKPPQFQSQYIPALFYVPAGKDPILFAGDPHNVGAVEAWAMQQHRATSFVSEPGFLRIASK